LIVEDNAELRTLAATLLEEAEFEVVEVGSGEEALHYLYHHAEEVAFLFADVRLPYLLSGVDLAHRVSSSGRGSERFLRLGHLLKATIRSSQGRAVYA
jgi:CheY-like chemotaxis protein